MTTKTTRLSIVAAKYAGPGAEALLADLRPGEELTLIREPTNPIDSYAVQVWARGQRVGYLPAKKNFSVAMAMDAAAAETNAPAEMKAKFSPSANSGFPQVEIDGQF